MEGATGKPLQCVVVTPEKAVLDEQVDFVALPMYDGELGVLPGRTALIGRLGAGELRIRHGDQVRRYFVDGGFAQVRGNTVTVLTSRAIKADEIDAAAVNHTLEAPPVAGVSADERLKAQARARAQLRVAQKAHAAAGPAH